MNRRGFIAAAGATATATVAGCVGSEAPKSAYSADVSHEVEQEGEQTVVNCTGHVGLTCHSGFGNTVDLLVTLKSGGETINNQTTSVTVDNCGVNYEFGVSFILDEDVSAVSSEVEIVNVNY